MVESSNHIALIVDTSYSVDFLGHMFLRLCRVLCITVYFSFLT